ncbi:MAG: DUF4197 domain-containing protein [Spirochaetaceae bacterium]|nr:DUF4197 domain-containing protein [Spirochaetaceae bacterium]
MKVFKSTLFFSCICSVLFVSCLSTDLGSLASGLMGGGGSSTRSSPFTNSEAIAAMKDALTEGIKSSSSQLSATDGYFGNAALKILLPDEADVMIDNIGKIPGGQKLVDDVILRLNRSAEEAAKEVVPIFTNVITGMSVSDGIAIVTGGENAATEYLREKTYSQLMDLYRPKVASALGKPLVAGISANSAWTTLTTNYNKVGAPLNKAATFIGKEEPMPEVEVDLATFATEKALDGLFSKIAQEEAEIRDNPLEYASSMIKKVFGAVKQGLVP